MVTQIFTGIKQMPPGYHFVTTDYEQVQVIYVQHGALMMGVQNSVTSLCAGQVCVLPVGSAFRLWCEQEGYEGVFVIGHVDRFTVALSPAMHGVSTPALRAIAELLEEEIRHPGQRTDAVVTHLGHALLELGLRMQEQPVATEVAAAQWVERVCRSIERTIYSGHSLVECLAGVPMSYRQLSRYFVQLVGMTPKQYQLHSRLQEAKRLLASTRQTVTAIALELGFANSQHFANQFHAHAGMTPSQFRAHACAGTRGEHPG